MPENVYNQFLIRPKIPRHLWRKHLHSLQDLCSLGPETSDLQPIFKPRFNFWNIYIKLLFNTVGCYWQWTNSCKPHCCHKRSSWKYSYYKYWWYNCIEQQHCCFQWRKQCWHGICCDERYCNEKKCRWWQLKWGNKAKCKRGEVVEH